VIQTAAVIGAGIGGLAAALALRSASVEVTVFEKAESLSWIQVGGGLHLWPNAVKVLRRLGLEQAVRAGGLEFQRAVFETREGRGLAEIPVGAIARELGTSCLAVRRPELHRILSSAVGEGSIRVGARCAGFREEPGGVTGLFADGREEHADVLIGADGMHSAARAQLLGDGDPSYATSSTVTLKSGNAA
jgi:2-polyprenyl-6-methoxyphenol hydroxylase-like FAD-dependent oxidoreductase